MSGRAATTSIIPGRHAISVGKTSMPTPFGWQWTLLSDISRLETGHTPSRRHPEYWEGGDISWIGIKDARLHHGKRIFRTIQKVTQAGIENSSSRKLPRGTVCLSRTASVGYVLVMGREMATSQDFVNWICTEALISEFLMYALMAEGDEVRRFGKGTTHTTIYFPEVKAFHICLPPLNEQQRIVAKIEELFSDLDAGVAALERAKANLKRYRAAVLQAAVEGKLTEAWRAEHPNVEPASKLIERILTERRQKWEAAQLTKYGAANKQPPKNWKAKYVEPSPPNRRDLPPLPDGWCWTSVDQLAAEEPYSLAIGPFGSNLKVSDYRDNGVPLIFVRNIRSESFGDSATKCVTETKARELGAHSVESGDILVTKMGDPPGDACLYPNGQRRAIITADCIKLRPHRFLPHRMFFVHSINSVLIRHQILGITKGVAQQKVSLGRFSVLALPLCPLEEQKVIVRSISEKLSQFEAAQVEIDRALLRAARLRQSILKQAFEGKLVPQDPTNEPASALLERIRAVRASQETNGKPRTKARTDLRRGRSQSAANKG